MSKDKYAGLPKQVREEAEAADRLAEELAAGKTPGTPGENPTPNGEAPKDPKQNPAPAQAPQETPVSPASEEEESFKRKYEVLKGKYDAEVPRLTNQCRALYSENTDLKTSLDAALNAPPTTAPAQVQGNPSSDAGAQPVVNPGDFEEYGDQFVNMAQRNNALEQRNVDLENKVNDMGNKLDAVTQDASVAAFERFQANLTGMKADWEAIDHDPAFDLWLYETGKKPEYVAAAQARDAQKVIDLMDLYLLRTGKTTGNNQPASPEPQNPPQKQAQAPVPDLESQIAPTSTGTGDAAQETAQGRVYNIAEVKEFYDAYAKMFFPFKVGDIVVNDPDEAARLDNDISRANVEGRIVG